MEFSNNDSGVSQATIIPALVTGIGSERLHEATTPFDEFRTVADITRFGR